MRKKLILASSSRIRKQILENAGVKFSTINSNVDEQAIKDAVMESGHMVDNNDLASILAQTKAQSVSEDNPETLVIGADQILVFANKIYSKPSSISEARKNLLMMRDQPHYLISSVACASFGAILWSYEDTACLKFRNFSSDFIDKYLEEVGESICSSVGAYQLEKQGIQLFSEINGNYFTILGLPLLPLLGFLRTHKILDS